MNLNEYQEFTRTTAVYHPKSALAYVALGLGSEAGEVQGKLKKVIRGDSELTNEAKEAILSECGDVLWYLVRLLDELGLSAEDCMKANTDKLKARQSRGTLRGDGDNR